SGKQWLNQLQVADGDGIEHQTVLALIPTNAVDVGEGSALRGANVVENSPGCGGSGDAARQSKSFERQNTEMILQQRDGVVGCEDPVVERSLGAGGPGRTRLRRWRGAAGFLLADLFLLALVSADLISVACGVEWRGGCSIQGVRGGKVLQVFPQAAQRGCSVKLRGAEFSSGKIQGGE